MEFLEPLDITQSVRKKLIHDLTPCGRAEEFMPVLGLAPGSEDVEVMEHEGSHDRLNTLAPINSILLVLAELAGEVIGRVILEDQGMEQDDDLVHTYQTVSIAASQAVVAHMMELNLLHIGGHS